MRGVLIVVLSLLVIVSGEEDPYGVTIVRSDFKKILKKKQSVTALFHSSSCPHSNSYKELFIMAGIKFKEQYVENNLAVVDCDTDRKLCDQYKVNILPSVYQIEEAGEYKKINEQEFLATAGVVVEKLLQAEDVARWLEEQPHYFVAVLEEEGFEAESRAKGDNIIYLSGNELYDVLLGYTRGKVGCWIFQYSISDSCLKKYLCGSGMDP